MAEPQEYLSDGSPLIIATQLGKLRLVRLLVEGGAQVNERNQRGETPLLVACKAMRGEQSGSTMLKLVHYLLKHQAEPNTQDKAGRTALMYTCIERAGAEVASTLIAAGADPSLEDYSGASALVYAINSHHQEMLKVLLDACRAKGCDIIIIATDLSPDGGAVTRRYLNVPPSPNMSPVSCMSPSDIELKTGSHGSEADCRNIFNFQGVATRRVSRGAVSSADVTGEYSKHQRLRSEPWLAIHNLAHLKQTYEEGLRQNAMQEEEEEEEDTQGSSHSTDIVTSLHQMSLFPGSDNGSDLHSAQMSHVKPDSGRTTLRGSTERLSVSTETQVGCGRRNTLPSLALPPSLQLPSLTLNYSNSDSYLHNQPGLHTDSRPLSSVSSDSLSAFIPYGVPSKESRFKKNLQERCGVRPQARTGSFLPPLPLNRASTASVFGHSLEMPMGFNTTEGQPNEHCQWRRKFPRRHYEQLTSMGNSASSEEYIYVL